MRFAPPVCEAEHDYTMGAGAVRRGGGAARLELLARGQAWVGKRLRVLLDGNLTDESRRFLEEMLAVHVENIDWCNRKAARDPFDRALQTGAPGAGERFERRAEGGARGGV